LEEAFQREMASAYREISRAALVEGKLEDGLEALEKARQWAPREAFPYLWKGRVYEHMGKTQKALETYKESLRHVNGGEGRNAIRRRIVGLLTQRLQAGLQQRDLSGALKTMDTLEPYLSEEQRRDVHYQKARIEMALGRTQEALVHYGLHISEAPQVLGDPRTRQELFDLLRDEPGLTGIIDDFSQASLRGKAAAARGDLPEALFCFLVARSDSRAEPGADVEVLRLLAAFGLNEEALAILSRQPKGQSPPRIPKTQLEQMIERAEQMVWEDYQKGRYEKGMERILGVETQLPEPTGKLSLMHAMFEERAGRYEEAIFRYEQALRSGERLSQVHPSYVRDHLCVLLIRKALSEYEEGNYETCFTSLMRAERLVPGRKDIAFNLGCVYLRLRNPHGALRAFSRYIELTQDESPRKELTREAVVLLQRQLARSQVVRYDDEGVSVDLIFERPVSLGHLLSVETEEGTGGQRQELLDSVLLAPYLERPLHEEGRGGFQTF
jgi:tetratricopeptide (TPR) repeat protein